MKIIYLTLLSTVFCCNFVKAQWSSINTNIITTNANVGIGTASPSAKLDVFGTFMTGGSDANLDKALYPNFNFLANTGKLLIGWNRSSGEGETNFITNRAAGGLGGFVFTDVNNNGIEKGLLWIRGNGDISIGTNDSKGYKLAVNGKIRAQEVKVEADNWPDYVFKKDYLLPSLNEVNDYVNAHHHLPGVPSADEVMKSGINLAEMNQILLKKIEELTLYLVERNSAVVTEQMINKNQEQRIKLLEKQLDDLSQTLKEKVNRKK